MEKNIKSIEDVIISLNERLWDIGNPFLKKHIEEYGSMITCSSDGDCVIIQFLGIRIWASDDDPREWNEERGMYDIELLDWCKKEIKRLIFTFHDIGNTEW
jgi:hypothetical protein